mgnify:CR=1 FL=1
MDIKDWVYLFGLHEQAELNLSASPFIDLPPGDEMIIESTANGPSKWHQFMAKQKLAKADAWYKEVKPLTSHQKESG